MLKPYAKYKETPALWLNSIPDHWESHKIRELFVERSEKVSDKDYSPLSVSKAGVVPQIATVAKTNNGDNRKLVRKGDFVINSRSDRRGSSGISNYDGSVSLINIVLKPRSFVNGRYMHYLLKSHYFIEEFYRNGRGIVADLWTTRYTEMKSIYLPVPSIEEQDQIVRFLDWKLAKINKLIQAKKKQIALLNEQRQVIIHNAVTKGVDPNVMMKDSGIEWIGQVPSHWKIYRNKNIFTLRKETVGESSKDYTLLSLTTNGITPRDIESGKGKFPSDFSTYQKVYSGDFVFCLFDIDETPRTVGLSSYEGMITGAYTVMNPKNADSLFIYYYYLSLDNKKALKPLYTGLRKVINTDVFLRSKIALPDINEQKQIVNYIENKINSINKAMYVIHSEISLLTEYRIRLISDVVTGKVDVRDIEIPEYEGDSDETIDDEIDDNLVLDEEDGEMEVE